MGIPVGERERQRRQRCPFAGTPQAFPPEPRYAVCGQLRCLAAGSHFSGGEQGGHQQQDREWLMVAPACRYRPSCCSGIWAALETPLLPGSSTGGQPAVQGTRHVCVPVVLLPRPLLNRDCAGTSAASETPPRRDCQRCCSSLILVSPLRQVVPGSPQCLAARQRHVFLADWGDSVSARDRQAIPPQSVAATRDADLCESHAGAIGDHAIALRRAIAQSCQAAQRIPER